MKKIKATLTVQSLDEAIRQVTEYHKRVIANIERLVKTMCEEGETYAIMHLEHVDTGETMASITAGYRSKNYGIIVAGGNAVWIEFGTGVYKNKVSAGQYAHPAGGKFVKDGIVPIGTYGEGHGSQMEGWYYPDPTKKTGWAWTRGIESNPFMWETAKFLRKNLRRFAKETFNDSDK